LNTAGRGFRHSEQCFPVQMNIFRQASKICYSGKAAMITDCVLHKELIITVPIAPVQFMFSRFFYNQGLIQYCLPAVIFIFQLGSDRAKKNVVERLINNGRNLGT